jgi:hypothetical protein
MLIGGALTDRLGACSAADAPIAQRLSVLEIAGMALIERRELTVRDGAVGHAFYPVIRLPAAPAR